MAILWVDDLEGQAIFLGGPAHQRAGVALIRQDALQARIVLPHRVEDQSPAGTVGEMAGWTTTFSKKHSGLDEEVTLAAGDLLVAIEPTYSAHQRLDRLAVNDRGAGRRIAPGMETCQLAQVGMDVGPGTV